MEIRKRKKSWWQKIYSALGFWTYSVFDGKNRYTVIYWCCFPYGKYFRKFDLIKIKYNGE